MVRSASSAQTPGGWERSKSLPEKRKPLDRAGSVDAGVELSPDLIWLIAADGRKKGIIAS